MVRVFGWNSATGQMRQFRRPVAPSGAGLPTYFIRGINSAGPFRLIPICSRTKEVLMMRFVKAARTKWPRLRGRRELKVAR